MTIATDCNLPRYWNLFNPSVLTIIKRRQEIKAIVVPEVIHPLHISCRRGAVSVRSAVCRPHPTPIGIDYSDSSANDQHEPSHPKQGNRKTRQPHPPLVSGTPINHCHVNSSDGFIADIGKGIGSILCSLRKS